MPKVLVSDKVYSFYKETFIEIAQKTAAQNEKIIKEKLEKEASL